MARKIPGIKIVWVQWLNDSIALWQRQDETAYLVPPEPPEAGESGGAALASPLSDPHQISSDPEPDADDWDQHFLEGAGGSRALGPLGVEGAPGEGEGLELDAVDWDEINDEVEAAMNESDDDGEGGGSGRSGGGMSEDEWTDETNSIIR